MAQYRASAESAAALLAQLGEKMSDYQDRYGLIIRGKMVPHSSAVRDYRCECGKALVTVWVKGGWKTVCASDETHPQSGFITVSAAAYRAHRQLAKEAEAQLSATIQAKEENNA